MITRYIRVILLTPGAILLTPGAIFLTPGAILLTPGAIPIEIINSNIEIIIYFIRNLN